MKFIHRFSRSVCAELTVSDTPPSAGQNPVLNVQWSGVRKPKHTREYVRWCNEIHRHLADLWNLPLLHCVQTGRSSWECWGYAPGEASRLLQKS